MEPVIQYAQTSDGVSIAFWTLGQGMPFVHMPPIPLSHVQLEWQIPDVRRWYERLAQGRKLVRYDCRGSGLSERSVEDFTLEAHVLDLEAVVDRLGLKRFALWGTNDSGAVAIAYAARHVDRISHLLLWCAYARGSDQLHLPQIQAMRALWGQDWEMFTETMAHAVLGWSAAEQARQFARFLRECVTQEALQAAYDATIGFDVWDLLCQVEAPTLMLHRRQVPWPQLDVARGLASGIPDARLALLEGSSFVPFLEGTESVLNAIDEFLGEGEAAATPELPEGTAVILFADIADSTALTEHLGDAAFRARARQLDASLRAVIRDSGGTPVEGRLLGDGVMAVFTSARQAIDCALGCVEAGSHGGLPLHLGIHAGDVIREEGNVYGGAVNVAARIAGASAPGEVLVSDIVRGLARTSADVVFEDRGQHSLKGVADPQRLFAVRPPP